MRISKFVFPTSDADAWDDLEQSLTAAKVDDSEIDKVLALVSKLFCERAKLRADLAEAVRLLFASLPYLREHKMDHYGRLAPGANYREVDAFLARFPEDKG